MAGTTRTKRHRSESTTTTNDPPTEKRAKPSTQPGSPVPESESTTMTTSIGRLRMVVGAHVSAAGGVQNAISNASSIGASTFALFLKPQRRWTNPELSPTTIELFKSQCKLHQHNPELTVPHGSYLVNLANVEKIKCEQAYESFVDDLSRCDRLGIRIYNFHPGSAVGTGGNRELAIEQVANQINRAHLDKRSGSVITVLETMAANPTATTLGGSFEDLSSIIDLVTDKSRIGVCIDTCHIFAAGYDLSTEQGYIETMNRFDSVVGFHNLRAVHVNDSKAPLGSNRDLHANIGTGFLGLSAFHRLMNDIRFQGIPMVLETPTDEPSVASTSDVVVTGNPVWAAEISLLDRLIGMDMGSDEFKQLADDLSAKGRPERDRVAEQVDKKAKKGKPASKPASKAASKPASKRAVQTKLSVSKTAAR